MKKERERTAPGSNDFVMEERLHLEAMLRMEKERYIRLKTGKDTRCWRHGRLKQGEKVPRRKGVGTLVP